jgi:hypothetical protein
MNNEIKQIAYEEDCSIPEAKEIYKNRIKVNIENDINTDS